MTGELTCEICIQIEGYLMPCFRFSVLLTFEGAIQAEGLSDVVCVIVRYFGA